MSEPFHSTFSTLLHKNSIEEHVYAHLYQSSNIFELIEENCLKRFAHITTISTSFRWLHCDFSMESKHNDGKPSFLLFKNIRLLAKKRAICRDWVKRWKKGNAKIKYMICFVPFLTLHCVLLGRKFHWWIIAKLSQCFVIKHKCWIEKKSHFFTRSKLSYVFFCMELF